VSGHRDDDFFWEYKGMSLMGCIAAPALSASPDAAPAAWNRFAAKRPEIWH
jgi:hypothetical protein